MTWIWLPFCASSARSGRAIERASDFRTIEAVFDRVNAASAQRKRGASDDYTRQHAGDEAPFDNDKDDREQRQIFGERQAGRRVDQPLIDQNSAEIEQQAAEHELRDIAKQRRIDDQRG